MSEDEAQALAEAIQARKAIPAAPQPRRVGSRARSLESVECRRAWTAGGWLPPALQSRFTSGESATLAVLLQEIAVRGQCALLIGAIAGRAGARATIVRNALAMSRFLGCSAVSKIAKPTCFDARTSSATM